MHPIQKNSFVRILALMTALVFCFGLAACGSTPNANTPAADPTQAQNAATPPAAPDPATPPPAAPAAPSFDEAHAISVISREDGSGTRGAFVELVGILNENKEDMTTLDAIITNDTAVMLTTVSGNPYAIGYISLGSLNDTVKAVAVDGVEATTANVENGSYAVSRPFNIATNGAPGALAQDFINYIMSAEGQAIVTGQKYIAVGKDAVSYTGGGQSGDLVVAGSSSVTPLMEKLKEAYIALNPGVNLDIQQSDSSIGMQQTIDGICDIGMASRALKDTELSAGLTPTVIAMDGIAVIVSNENPTADLTKDQIKNIFTGAATAWNGIG